ncbi:MAG: LytTR family DNA-binding domain-containing protein [Cytophagales bacterium]|nr:LytTR family DNA-binding domain-containing protein [Cytophagales bacterium]
MIRTVLIADDEPNAREYLTRLISKRDDLKLLGAMKNGQEVLNFCQTMMPDILILDIEMPGVNGLEVARMLTRKSIKTTIIFSTAFDQYAIDAFNVAAIGYLLKPYGQQQLNQVIDRSLAQLMTQDRAEFSKKIQSVWEQLERKPNDHLQAIEIKEKGLIRTIPAEELIQLEADSEYVKLHTHQSVFLHRTALSLLEKQLPPYFRRVHRSFIINTNHMTSYKYLGENRFEFTMTNKMKVTSSRSYREAINQWLTK